MAEAEATARAARRLAETEARAWRPAEAERAGAKVGAAMEDPDAEVFLEDGGVNGEGTAVHDGEGEASAARRNLTTPPARRPPNFQRQFRTPQVIRTDTQVENSQLQPNQFPMEAEIESTASSPQPPLPRGSGSSSLPPIPKPSGARTGMGAASGEPRPSRKTTSPVKVNKRNVRIKRRSSKTTSDVWDYFTQEDTDDGPIAICGFCDQNYMSLTVHWINNRWELQRKVLNFCFLSDHSGATIGRKVEECHRYHHSKSLHL